MRAAWTVHDNQWRNEHDKTRTIYHDDVLAAFNILARYLEKEGRNTAWMDTLGRSGKGLDRKRVGDFACFLTFIQGINGR